MTTIVGIVGMDGRVMLGADSAVYTTYTLRAAAGSKLARLGDAVVGVAGSPRVLYGMEANRALLLPIREPVQEWIAQEFTAFMRRALSDYGALSEDSGEKRLTGDSILLIGVGGRLFTIYQDFSLFEYAEPYTAIGSGAELALGAMHAATRFGWTGQRVLEAGLEAAAHFSSTTSGPFTYLTT